VLGDAAVGIAVAGKEACFSARRDIARRMTGRPSCTMTTTDAGMPISMATKETKSTGIPVSQPQDMDQGYRYQKTQALNHAVLLMFRVATLGGTVTESLS
jgi:hypothetical protein